MDVQKPLTPRDLIEQPHLTARLIDFTGKFPLPDQARRVMLNLGRQHHDDQPPIIYVGDLVAYTEKELMYLPKFGKKSLEQLKQYILEPLGLSIATPIDHPAKDLHFWLQDRLKEAEQIRKDAGIAADQPFSLPKGAIKREYKEDAEIVTAVMHRLKDPKFRARQVALLQKFPEIK